MTEKKKTNLEARKRRLLTELMPIIETKRRKLTVDQKIQVLKKAILKLEKEKNDNEIIIEGTKTEKLRKKLDGTEKKNANGESSSG